MNSYYVYVYVIPFPPRLPTRLSRRRFLATPGTKHIIEHAVPDLSHDTNLLLDRFRHGGHHEVRHGVEVHAIGVTVVGVGHGQDDREGRSGDNLGFHDDLMILLARSSMIIARMVIGTHDFLDLGSVGTCAGRREIVGHNGHAHH